MTVYNLKFAQLIHEEGILEIIVNSDIELTASDVKDLFSIIKSIEPKVSLVLVNRINRYSYTFKANFMLATSKLAEHVAVVKYGRLPWPLKGIFTPKFYRIAFFDERSTAIDWLNSKNVNSK